MTATRSTDQLSECSGGDCLSVSTASPFKDNDALIERSRSRSPELKARRDWRTRSPIGGLCYDDNDNDNSTTNVPQSSTSKGYLRKTLRGILQAPKTNEGRPPELTSSKRASSSRVPSLHVYSSSRHRSHRRAALSQMGSLVPHPPQGVDCYRPEPGVKAWEEDFYRPNYAESHRKVLNSDSYHQDSSKAASRSPNDQVTSEDSDYRPGSKPYRPGDTPSSRGVQDSDFYRPTRLRVSSLSPNRVLKQNSIYDDKEFDEFSQRSSSVLSTSGSCSKIVKEMSKDSSSRRITHPTSINGKENANGRVQKQRTMANTAAASRPQIEETISEVVDPFARSMATKRFLALLTQAEYKAVQPQPRKIRSGPRLTANNAVRNAGSESMIIQYVDDIPVTPLRESTTDDMSLERSEDSIEILGATARYKNRDVYTSKYGATDNHLPMPNTTDTPYDAKDFSIISNEDLSMTTSPGSRLLILPSGKGSIVEGSEPQRVVPVIKQEIDDSDQDQATVPKYPSLSSSTSAPPIAGQAHFTSSFVQPPQFYHSHSIGYPSGVGAPQFQSYMMPSYHIQNHHTQAAQHQGFPLYAYPVSAPFPNQKGPHMFPQYPQSMLPQNQFTNPGPGFSTVRQCQVNGDQPFPVPPTSFGQHPQQIHPLYPQMPAYPVHGNPPISAAQHAQASIDAHIILHRMHHGPNVPIDFRGIMRNLPPGQYNLSGCGNFRL